VGDLLFAAKALKEITPQSFEVHIAGDGPFLQNLKDLASELNMQNVTFHGWLRDAELGALLESVDAMIVPDPDSEYAHYCAMNKVTHSMAFGLPVIARPLRENVRVLGDLGIVARDFTVDGLAEAMGTFAMMTTSRRAALSTALRDRHLAEFSWERQKQAYLMALDGCPAAHDGAIDRQGSSQGF
jgi:glycosyltransferase involved in cell wall biosynthesis